MDFERIEEFIRDYDEYKRREKEGLPVGTEVRIKVEGAFSEQFKSSLLDRAESMSHNTIDFVEDDSWDFHIRTEAYADDRCFSLSLEHDSVSWVRGYYYYWKQKGKKSYSKDWATIDWLTEYHGELVGSDAVETEEERDKLYREKMVKLSDYVVNKVARTMRQSGMSSTKENIRVVAEELNWDELKPEEEGKDFDTEWVMLWSDRIQKTLK